VDPDRLEACPTGEFALEYRKRSESQADCCCGPWSCAGFHRAAARRRKVQTYGSSFRLGDFFHRSPDGCRPTSPQSLDNYHLWISATSVRQSLLLASVSDRPLRQLPRQSSKE